MNYLRDRHADSDRPRTSVAVDRHRIPGELVPRNERRRYSVRDFADDQLRLISARAADSVLRPAFLSVIDGRMVIVRQQASAAVSHHEGVFADKYGAEAGGLRHTRFRLVLEFLRRWGPEISQAGLALATDPMTVREEFVSYLLEYELSLESLEIPKSAIADFLDEWGLRWM